MGELKTFSVETDSTVLLTFTDGVSRRVSTRHLSQYLSGADLVKVRQALKLRRNFWRLNLPKGGLAIGLVIGAMAIGVAGTDRIDHLVRHNGSTAEVAPRPESPAPTLTPTPAPTTGTVAGVATMVPGSPVPAASPKPKGVLPVQSHAPESVANHFFHSVDDATKNLTTRLAGLLK